MQLAGSARGILLRVERFEIHEQPNWRLLYRLETEPEGVVHETRLAVQSVYENPAAGDLVRLEMVMGEPVAVRPA